MTITNPEIIAILGNAATSLEQGWCQGAGARDAAGNKVSIDDPAACSWCFYGALAFAIERHQAALGRRSTYEYWLTGQLSDRLGLTSPIAVTRKVIEWNDAPERKKEEVLALLRDYAATLETP